MAIGDPYATLTQIKAYLKITNIVDDDLLTSAVASISTEIEDHCERQFNDAGVVSPRLYRALSPTLLFVDDFSTSAGLVVAVDEDGDGVFETVWVAGDYELRPKNGIVNGRPGWPFTSIRPRERSTMRFRGEVQVTARWGWATVPKPIYEATLILAKDTFALKDTRFGVAGFNQFGPVRVRDNALAAEKVQPYERHPVKVG